MLWAHPQYRLREQGILDSQWLALCGTDAIHTVNLSKSNQKMCTNGEGKKEVHLVGKLHDGEELALVLVHFCQAIDFAFWKGIFPMAACEVLSLGVEFWQSLQALLA
jgi:hypothetical protein